MNYAKIRGVDHFGLTVESLRQATHDLKNALDAEVCYLEGPIIDKEPGWMAAKLGASGSCTLTVAALNVLGINLELFEYNGADRPNLNQAPQEPGFFLILQTPAPDQVIARFYHERAIVNPAKDSAGGYEVTLPSGIKLSIQPGPIKRLLGAVALNQADFALASTELTAVFGFTKAERFSAFGAAGYLLTAHQGLPWVLLERESGASRPTNSDLGGHHVAFHADNVAESVAAMHTLHGYAARGEAETITTGPIAGDCWVYLDSPFGLQLEIINMPDGTLPYEKTTAARRTPIAIGAFS